MTTELLEIQPRELKFIFELKKQSSCSVRLVNNFHHYVAFKVKTTCPKKYSVRPNIGIIEPKSTSDFIVTMQAQRLAPPDMICKDKFLIQSTIVPIGTTDKDITPSMFAKDDGKYIEENKLRVILVSPPHSPVLSPINGVLKQGPAYETSILKDQLLSRVEIPIPHHIDAKDFEELKIIKGEELKPAKNVELKTVEDVEVPKIVNCEELKPVKNVELKTIEDMEEPKLVKDIEEMKSKINELESKLHEAEVTISKQTQRQEIDRARKGSFSTRTFSVETQGWCEKSSRRISFSICLFGGAHQCHASIPSTPMKKKEKTKAKSKGTSALDYEACSQRES